MSLFNLYDDEVTLEELQQLISNQTSEKRTIDYKLTLELDGDEKKKEFLADIISFANTNGGFIVYGMNEKDGIAKELVGISSPSYDILKGQIENIIRDGIAPKLNTVIVRDIDISEYKKAIVIKIPQSWSAPHLVWYKRSSKFFARNSSHGKYQLEISDIRTSILSSENLYERIRNFRLDRISKILNNQTPVLINGDPKFVFHIIPLNTINFSQQIDFSSDMWSNICNSSDYRGFHIKHNFDGFVFHNQSDNNTPADHYIQFFRNGRIEITNTSCTTINDGNKLIYCDKFESICIFDVPINIRSLLNFNFGFPIIIMLSVLDIKGYSMWYNTRRYFMLQRNPIDLENLLIDEIIIQSIDEMKNKYTFKPLLDPVWNACGIVSSLNFKSNGVWSTD